MIIQHKKSQTVLDFALLLAVTVGLGLFAIFDLRSIPHDYSMLLDTAIYWILRALAAVCAIITAFASAWFFKQIFSNAPLIVICDEYFCDNSSSTSLGKIAWEDMDTVYIKGGFLNIKLKNPEKYFARKNRIQMKLIMINLKLGYGDACISTQRFQKDAIQFIEEFSKRKHVSRPVNFWRDL